MSKPRSPKRRAVHGILLVDKPIGLSSNDVLQRAKRIYNAAKAGHTGALDPLATGMLPICFGEATKFSQFLLDADKRYQVTAKLGVRTNTSDAEGEVVATKPVNVTLEQLNAALETFKGDILQVPSMFSALKFEGKPLYEYARQGIEIERPARPITIFALELLEFSGDEVRLDVHCSKGTYIRSLVDDLGELLGCGAHVAKLHRSHVAQYPTEKMISLEALQAILTRCQEQEIAPRLELDPLLLPMDTAVAGLPEANMSDEIAYYVNLGQAVQLPNLPATGTQMRLTKGSEYEFFGIGEVNADGLIAPKRLVRYEE